MKKSKKTRKKKLFMNKYNWKGINHPSERKGLEKKLRKII